MKRFSIIIIAMTLCAAALAQESLHPGKQVFSPQISQDNTVTFRLDAPDASSVRVTGDFLPVVKVETPDGEIEVREAELHRNAEGVWEYTSEALSPELYYYNFILDGVTVTDPANVHMIRDVKSVMNVFLIGGDRADLYAVNDAPHGTVSRVWYDSPSLGLVRRMTVYTPAGYEDSDRSYPVFYLLHGMGGDEEAWISLGRAAQILDNLIAEGRAEPMIVVMTNGNASQQAAPGESSLGFAQPDFRNQKTMEGSFELAFPDVISFVESHWRVIADKRHRAIAGLSMGGFHSMHISKYYPDTFDYVGLFSAAILGRESGQSPVYDDFEGKLAVQFEKKPSLYWIGIGKDDFLYEDNVKFRALLDSKGYPYTYYESEGGHIWRNWRIYLTEFAPLLFK